MEKVTFKSVTDEQLVRVYTGELWDATDRWGNWNREVLLECAKHNGYTAQDVLNHPVNDPAHINYNKDLTIRPLI